MNYPEAIDKGAEMNYPEVIDEAPMHIGAQALHEAVNRYCADPIAENVALAIAGYANSKGEAFPGLALLSRLTGYTIQEVSRAVHRLMALGILTIRKVKAKGAPYAHNVYHFAENFIHRTVNKASAHFIGNLKNWKAKAEDVAAAVVDHAQQAASAALDALSEKAAKMAAVFQEKPELLESPEKAAHVAGIVGTEPVSEPHEWEGVSAGAPVAWEEADAMTEPPATAAPSDTLADGLTVARVEESPCVYASWRDRVAAYRKETVKS